MGEAAQPVVRIGDPVEKGSLIAKVPDGKLGADIHASINGKVIHVNDRYIRIAS